MANFKLPKMSQGLMNFSVVRDDGAVLSFAADDSCGAARDSYIRTYLQLFDTNGDDMAPQEYAITPDEYLSALASFLGYRVTKK
jgi:hypothetical protein